jgi:Domain of unknown function (DUF4173)
MTEPIPDRPDRAAAAPSRATTALPLLLTLGLAGLALLLTRGTAGRLGLNVLLLSGSVVAALLLTLKRQGQRPQPAALAVLGLGLLCALGLALRDGPLMTGLNLLGLLLAAALGLSYLRLPGLPTLSVGRLLQTLLLAAARLGSGLIASGLHFPWGSGRRYWGHTRTRPVLTGLLLTAPLLLVFGTLLGSADDRFGQLLSGLFRWDLGDLPATLFQLTGWAFGLGGLVYAALLDDQAVLTSRQTGTSGGRLGLTELGLPLLSLSLLFCVYLGVQASYLFGSGLGQGLSYSEHVRRGFGELSAVAILTLAVLLLAHTLLRRELRTGLTYRLLSAAVLLPLGLLIVSAYHRLTLYVLAYGLSEIRVLGAVFLAWVVLSLLVYTALLWRGGLERFVYFSLISGLSLTAGLNVVNPGRLIASVNVQRDLDGVQNDLRTTRQRADVTELLALGADSVPVIVTHWEALTGPADLTRAGRLTLLRAALSAQVGGEGWRSWNLARRRAAALLAQLP